MIERIKYIKAPGKSLKKTPLVPNMSCPSSVESEFKPLIYLNQFIGISLKHHNLKWFKIYSVIIIVFNLILYLGMITNKLIWCGFNARFSSKILSCLVHTIKTLILIVTIIDTNFIQKKKKYLKRMMDILQQLELELGQIPKQINLELILTLTYWVFSILIHAYYFNSYCELVYFLCDDFRRFHVLVIAITFIKFLRYISDIFDLTNQKLGDNLVLNLDKMDRIYQKLDTFINLWNEVYGTQLLIFFLFVLSTLIQNVTKIVRNLRKFGPHFNWELAMSLQVICAYMVGFILLKLFFEIHF